MRCFCPVDRSAAFEPHSVANPSLDENFSYEACWNHFDTRDIRLGNRLVIKEGACETYGREVIKS
jgi:hypothetical protein